MANLDEDASSEPTKVCSAGCGVVLDRTEFSKKQWSARAVRRCIDCVKTGVDPKLCTHGRGIFDCEACLEEDNAQKLKAAAKIDLERPISRVWQLNEFPCERIFFGTKLVTDAIVQISPSAVIINCEHDVYIHSMDIREFRWSKTIFSPLHNRKAYDFFAIRVDKGHETNLFTRLCTSRRLRSH